MTTIRYFIPEDGDDEFTPNVFLAAKSRHPGHPPSLGQIKDAFPLPGRYHFRFKSPLVPGGDRDKDGMAVWMDCVQDNAPVPTWRNSIIAKVTRTGVEDDDDDDDDFVGRGDQVHHAPAASSRAPPAPAPQQSAPRMQSAQNQQSHQQPSLDIFDGPSPPSVPASSSMPTSAPPSTGNLLDGHHHPAPAPPSGGLLDMDAPVYVNQGANQSNAHSDFLGMTAPTTSHNHTPPPSYGVPNAFGGQPQQQQQRPPQSNQNAFSNFSDQQGPFGGLGTPWK